MKRTSADFRQEGPRLGNQYEEDTFLQDLLARLLPDAFLQRVRPDLVSDRFGYVMISSIHPRFNVCVQRDFLGLHCTIAGSVWTSCGHRRTNFGAGG